MTTLQFGRWTVIDAAPRSARKQAQVLTRCACGTTRITRVDHLRSGRTTQCNRCANRMKNVTHGRSRTTEYQIWGTMIQRCTNPQNPGYPRYGGRGITVCSRWHQSFEAFLADMGYRPSTKHTLDRINNDGPYEPQNVRWATHRVQMNNKASNHWLAMNGKRRTLAQWSRSSGIKYVTILKRLKLGWSVDRALSTPVAQRSAAQRLIEALIPPLDRGE